MKLKEYTWMISINAGYLARWIGWAAIWTSCHVEIHTMSDWTNTPEVVVNSLVLYIISGLILEMIYRKIVWGEVNPRREIPKVKAPNSTGRQWTSFQEKDPPENEAIEVYCADGVSRMAKAHGISNGRLLLDINYEAAIKNKQQENPMKYRPTHWRDFSDVL